MNNRIAGAEAAGYCKSFDSHTLTAPTRTVKRAGMRSGTQNGTTMLCPTYPPAPLVKNWLERHRGATSFVLHMIGIPPTILGILFIPIYIALLSWPIFLLALCLFFGGYAIQFLGHALEGTDPGEIIMVKRWLGWPYVEFARPRKSRQSVA